MKSLVKSQYYDYPSQCTHQESTEKVLMLENAASSHEYWTIVPRLG